MNIQIITQPINRGEARKIAEELYVDMVKGVVDLERGVIALGGEWHIDANNLLIEDGSKQSNIWGFNFYPDENTIHFTSLINIRPSQNNRAIEIQDENIRKQMEKIIRRLII